MKKDYIKVSEENEGTDESEFIERHWTNIWKDRRIAGAEYGLSRREEYQIIRPYVMALPLGARILDAGCGLGEWTLFFSQQGYDAVGLAVRGESPSL